MVTPAPTMKINTPEPLDPPTPAPAPAPARTAPAAPPRPRAGAMIVCTPDGHAQSAVREFVTRLGLELHEITADPATRLTEQLDAQPHLDFALILNRPDDATPTAFELGYCVGRLGAKRVYVLAPADDKLTCDPHGLLHIPLDPADGWQLHLARQFKRAGLEVDLNRVF
jgi:predicted nucleotide-binding protein